MTSFQQHKMIDFPKPVGKLTGYAEITNRDVAPNHQVGKVRWSSLLGKDNEEFLKLSLYYDPNFIAHILSTRENLKVNNSNTKKYPKMDDEEWE